MQEDTYFNWYAEPYKSFQNSKIALFENSLHKGEGKLKTIIRGT